MDGNPSFKFGEAKRDPADVFLEKVSTSKSLKWYVDPSRPLWPQYVYLWFKRHVFRRTL